MRGRWVAAIGIALALGCLLPAMKPERYLSPIELSLSGDGGRLYIVCEGSDELAVLDLASGKVLRRVAVGHVPKGLAASPDGKTLYVVNSWDDNVSAIDAGSLEVKRTLPAGFEPNSAALDREGKFLYVANRIGNDISVVDLATGAESRRLLGGRGASYLAASPDGRIYATHILPEIGPYRTAPESEITVVDGDHQVVQERKRLHNAAGVFHVALSADGRLGMTTQMRPKNLPPLAHVAHGFTIGNSISVFGEDIGEPVQLPLDGIDRFHSLPFGVVIAPDKKTAYVSFSGGNEVAVLDLVRLTNFVKGLSPRERERVSNDLSASAEYVTDWIPVGANPKGMALSPDGSRLYVANRLDDTVSVIDTAKRTAVSTLTLGGPEAMSQQRRGEKLFHDARYSFGGQFGCASCHIEGTFDGLAWDLEPDGFGIDIVDNKLLENVKDTAPFKWNGGNPDLQTECGPRTEKFFYRSQSYSPEQLKDLVAFIESMPSRPNRFRLKDGNLTAAQERGLTIFERTRKRNGQPIPEELQCPACHPGPLYTNRYSTNVGSGKPTDRSPLFDTPQLFNVALSAPYLHDGSARTMEEIWTVFSPRDTHGVTNDLNKDELNDLIEFLKTL